MTKKNYTTKGLNDTQQKDWSTHMPYIWQLCSHALRIWDLFDFNLPLLQERGLPVRLLPLGYHPKLDSSLPSKSEFDCIFFGSHSEYRTDIFAQLQRNNIELHTLNFAPNLFRDDILRKSRVNINIPLNATEMFHVSPNRVTAGLYHHTPTVGPQCRCSSWLKAMYRGLDGQNFVQELAHYIKEKQYVADRESFRAHFTKMHMNDILHTAIEELHEEKYIHVQ